MKYYLLLCVAILFSNCDKSLLDYNLSNDTKDAVHFLNEDYFNKAYLAGVYYQKYGRTTIWQDETDRQQLIDFLSEKIEREGFSKKNYPIEQLEEWHFSYEKLNYYEQVQADLDFTHTFLNIALHLQHSAINPKKLFGDWEPSKKRKINPDLLHQAIGAHDINKVLTAQIPTQKLYTQLRDAWNNHKTKQDVLTKTLRINMEKARWLPEDMGQYYLWVNLPEEVLRVMENGTQTQEYKVIIGKPERKSPVLSSVINQIVINPKWTVPPTILKNDLVPKATANRGYFANQRMKIIHNKTGKVVSPANWNPANYNSYRYVQETGSNNALGLVKFNFPNDHMVYIHDTNHREMFANKKRALSSGCVRVQNPFDLAEKVLQLNDKNISRAELDTLVKKKNTKNIDLKKIVHIHQTYLTAYIENNEIKRFDDVYNLDNTLYQRILKL